MPHRVRRFPSTSNPTAVVNEYMNTVQPGEIKRIDRRLHSPYKCHGGLIFFLPPFLVFLTHFGPLFASPLFP